jgi:Sigma-70 region 2
LQKRARATKCNRARALRVGRLRASHPHDGGRRSGRRGPGARRRCVGVHRHRHTLAEAARESPVSLRRDRGRAEDLAQEAFLRAYRRLGQWRREAAFSTWLFALATPQAIWMMVGLLVSAASIAVASMRLER